MPIGGFVVSVDPVRKNTVSIAMAGMQQVDVCGADDKGHIIVVIDTDTTDQMQNVVSHIESLSGVLSVGLTYIHSEDEMEKIASGEVVPDLSRGRRHEKH